MTSTTPETTPKTPEGTTLLTEGDKAPVAPKAPVEGAPKPDATTVPEKYEFTLPEGVALDEKALGEITPLLKEAGINQETAQKFMDFHVAQLQATAGKATEAGAAEYTKTRADWRNALAADPDIGSKLPEVKVAVGRALDSLGDPKLAADFRAAMDLTGVGDNPAFVKAFYRFAERMTEGSSVAGGGPSAAGQKPPGTPPPSIANAMYPNLK